MRNSSSASSETRLLVPPNALVAGSWPAPPGPAAAASGVTEIGADSIHHEVIGIGPLAVDAELALLVEIGGVRTTPGASSIRELKLRPFRGMFSTKRLPMTVLTDASDALSSGALPSTVTLSLVLPMAK